MTSNNPWQRPCLSCGRRESRDQQPNPRLWLTYNAEHEQQVL